MEVVARKHKVFVPILAVVAMIGLASLASLGTAADARGSDVRAADPADVTAEEPGWATLSDDYKSLYPDLSDAQIAERRVTQELSEELNEEFAGLPGFAGVVVDWEGDGDLVISSTGQNSLDEMAKTATEAGVAVEPRLVSYDLGELESAWDQAGQITLDIEGADATLDVLNNRVLVTLPATAQGRASQLTTLSGVETVYTDETAAEFVPAVCTSRISCGFPVRGGVTVGPNNSGTQTSGAGCTLGFAVAASDGSRWVYMDATTAATVRVVSQ